MNLENKKVVELKKICIEKKLKGYSKLNKEELVQLLSKKNNSKKKSGFDQTVYDTIMAEQADFKKFLNTYYNNTYTNNISGIYDGRNTNTITYNPITFKNYIQNISIHMDQKIFKFNSYSEVV